MKKTVVFGMCLFSLQALSSGKESLANKMAVEIAGGPDRPMDVVVNRVGDRFHLVGSVDHLWAKKEAMEICRSMVAKHQLAEGACVDLVSLRAGIPEEPRGAVWLEYQVVQIPDLRVPAMTMLDPAFFSAENRPASARVVTSFAIKVNERPPQFSDNNSASYRDPATVGSRGQEFAAGGSGEALGFELSSHVRQIPASDRMRLYSDLTLRWSDNGEERRFRSEVDISNFGQTALTSWSELQGDRAVGWLVLVTAKRTRRP